MRFQLLSRMRYPMLYGGAFLLALLSVQSDCGLLQHAGEIVAEIFVKIFKCISLPLFALSLIVTLAQQEKENSVPLPWKRTLCYTVVTTLVAATVSCLLYLVIRPQSIQGGAELLAGPLSGRSYGRYLLELFPRTFLTPFLEQQVGGVLFIALLFGIALRTMHNTPSQLAVLHFFQGMHTLLLILTRWIVALLPLALFGFVTVALLQLRKGESFYPLSGYLAVVIAANLIQGFVILPLWLWWNRIVPWTALKAMAPALSVAFFSKSSTAALPMTIELAEQRLKISPEICRFVLPLCTALNMNGCAAFIFTTVIYLMQNHGIEITASTYLIWIGVATIAAIGNAGVPMGCFFLSTTLLVSLDIPINLLGLILPFYAVLDMLETALNVWSDSCIAIVVQCKTP